MLTVCLVWLALALAFAGGWMLRGGAHLERRDAEFDRVSSLLDDALASNARLRRALDESAERDRVPYLRLVSRQEWLS